MTGRASFVVLGVVVGSGCVERADVLLPAHDSESVVAAVTEVALGDEHGCAIRGGRAYCWGNNARGQLGIGTTTASTVPAPVPIDSPVVAISAGAFHTCALDELGSVFCWGDNRRGQLGTGDREQRFSPVAVALPSRASSVTTDFEHSCALLADATLRCWGKNDEGDLGQGDAFPGDQSTAADGLTPLAVGGSYRYVDTGQGHTCAIRLDGTLACWGRNSEHELGPADPIQIREPVTTDPRPDWLGVDAGQNHTCGVLQDLTLWCWGLNNSVRDALGAPLGLGSTELVVEPTRLDLPAEFTLLRTDTFHSCAIDRARRLFCWGRGNEGQLGLGDSAFRELPALVASRTASVAVGRFHTCAISIGGELACAGKNDEGQLGLGDATDRATFEPVNFPLEAATD